MHRYFVLLSNIIVFCAALFLLESSARLYLRARTPRDDDSGSLRFQFYPYVMTGQVADGLSERWRDVIRNKSMDVHVSTNNAGFPDTQDFNISSSYAKQANEKTVLLTGGSTAFGVGATSNANITHEKLERFLNAAQTDIHYTVVNLAQGGWIAQQEAISLDLWGRLFDPDWIITLDGVNDSTVGCAMSQGTGNPVYFQLINALVTGYLSKQTSAVFYRGFWENQLIKYSAAYRLLTAKTYIAPPSGLDKGFGDSLLQVTTPTLLSNVRDQTSFYVLAQESILERFQDVKFILSTQPTAQDFSFELGDFYRAGESYSVDLSERIKFADYLDTWLDSVKPRERFCSSDAQGVGLSTRYILAMGAIRLAWLVEDFRQKHRRDVEYFNTGLLYPKDPAKRANYFIDDYHLNDSGQEVLARFYAYKILTRSFPDRDWSSMRPEILWFE